MRKYLLAIALLTIAVATGAAAREGTVYRWVDEDGITHYDDSVPPEYREHNKDILTDEGIKVGSIRGRRTAEELAAEQRAAELQQARDLQIRADRALLATYLSVDEIRMHRDRRVELFKAQSRVTELFLTNLEGRLRKLERQASRYQPYSTDPDAVMVDPNLVLSINDTKSTIERHERNLEKFVTDEQQIVARFEGDINRFKTLRGID
jgi:hypothetical protein